ncbi:putative Ribonuclease inhibitor [Cocos nucifera]|uniref:Putative Ribonuclease inhibitor n=1 Tax=Cocos nucifera TaxID=13894 RepID=A0A8K0IJ74_COCNU|nr:putative Ribonuclease inhibitor [Cocos nucifera]
MPEVPTLFSLCVKGIAITVLDGCEYAQDILELPSDLLDRIVLNLPPLALQNIHELSVDGCGKGGIASNGISDGRKRGRYGDFNTAWKLLFKKRWPEHIKKIQPINCATTQYTSGMCSLVNQSVDWQQLYWEKHLQRDSLASCF